MGGAMNMLDIKAQLLIAVILVSATGAMSAETIDQSNPPVAPAATEIVVPKAEAVKKADARKQQQAEAADQTTLPVTPASSEIAAPRVDAVKKSEPRKQAQTASNWRCGWGLFSWVHSCSGSSGRTGLVLGTAY
jgi:hypothetical protein